MGFASPTFAGLAFLEACYFFRLYYDRHGAVKPRAACQGPFGSPARERAAREPTAGIPEACLTRPGGWRYDGTREPHGSA